jgi:hypothetical protein
LSPNNERKWSPIIREGGGRERGERGGREGEGGGRERGERERSIIIINFSHNFKRLAYQ